ncbi:MAG TPA: flagellar motor protein MotB [Stellaceae bacterium]|nr:flagellar motor protein MotB [Stellaceae bacterium]
MKGQEPEKAPNHERWIISYADFTTLLLATFVVMYAVSSINSSKFQEMAESFSTAFIGRTNTIKDSGFSAAEKGPFNFMPNPVHLPVITREEQVKNMPPALRQEPTTGDPNQKPDKNGKYAPSSGAPQQSGATGQEQGLNGPNAALRRQVEARVQGLDSAYDQLAKALAALIGKGEVHVSLQPLGVVIDINEMLLFASGKADLTPDALPLIDRIAKILVDLHYQIQVNGFTDNVPIHTAQFDSNWDLSATRAISVVKRFVAAGIDPTLLVGAGFGEYHPIAPNSSPEGKAANRRVSIVVVSPIAGDDPERSRLIGSNAERAAPGGEAPEAGRPVLPPNAVPPGSPVAPQRVIPPAPAAALPAAAPSAAPAAPAASAW